MKILIVVLVFLCGCTEDKSYRFSTKSSSLFGSKSEDEQTFVPVSQRAKTLRILLGKPEDGSFTVNELQLFWQKGKDIIIED